MFSKRNGKISFKLFYCITVVEMSFFESIWMVQLCNFFSQKYILSGLKTILPGLKSSCLQLKNKTESQLAIHIYFLFKT